MMVVVVSVRDDNTVYKNKKGPGIVAHVKGGGVR